MAQNDDSTTVVRVTDMAELMRKLDAALETATALRGRLERDMKAVKASDLPADDDTQVVVGRDAAKRKT